MHPADGVTAARRPIATKAWGNFVRKLDGQDSYESQDRNPKNTGTGVPRLLAYLPGPIARAQDQIAKDLSPIQPMYIQPSDPKPYTQQPSNCNPPKPIISIHDFSEFFRVVL